MYNFYKQLSVSGFIEALKRKKKIDPNGLLTETRLARVLTTFDLTALGVGSTLGLGIYVLAGQVASTKSGPAVILSFAVAAIASLFAGLCYAEFGARVPKAGSAYVYSYITVGEFMAFIIGWNLVLEYLIGTASVARGYSGYLDSLLDMSISKFFRHWMPMNVEHLSSYPDFLAFFITVSLSVMLSFGVKESTRFNSIFTTINILIVIYVIVCGAFKIDFHNWNLSQEEVDKFPVQTKVSESGRGSGGFMPFGFSGMMAGAATCFYGFIGFDVIATTGEEAKNPRKSIPIAIAGSLFLVFIAYTGVSGVQTLMWPYFDQNTDAPLPYVFERVGYRVAKWILSIGALCGLSTSLLGAMFPLPRVLYAMATDGLIFRTLSDVNERYKTPILATILSGIFAAVLAAIFDVTQLADMMSIGTLLAYSLVAISVLILRTRYDEDDCSISFAKSRIELNDTNNSSFVTLVPSSSVRTSDGTVDTKTEVQIHDTKGTIKDGQSFVNLLLNLNNECNPNETTSRLSLQIIIFSTISIFLMDLSLVLMEDRVSRFEPLALTSVTFTVLMFISSIILLARQPMDKKKLSFQVPWVPFIPLLSVAINVYLMMKLSYATWIRFGIWMLMGFAIYFGYGIRESTGTVVSINDRTEKKESSEPVNIVH